ncbi:GAF domain-containing sensor histidine kinase [Desulforamulus hydrothermalis]|uniref:histidine kinase n=1 Tax=Desulforamulus hydrothermalis Lam5 = DSM 18033 TaxID=1121428 RepID=K8EC97_9FIRM|nr:ATP-binding protein [Desulforamulus hydrothermalis]CCO09308.1 ATP-binding region ATPase domain protein [Desulforamulus hydrothermalis Lam5 = DSM 18033]SHH04450.1 GAF sensor signal transduction histidine kinase [Desulforamulus hydrothermalis Lam5 = DSM 18033]
MFDDKISIIQNLTGVNSSKLNYYLEVQRSNEKIKIQINRLELLHQLIKDINIDMSLADILERVYNKLPQAVPCCFLGLALAKGDRLVVTAAMPDHRQPGQAVPKTSLLWQCYTTRRRLFYNQNRDGQPACPAGDEQDPMASWGLKSAAIVPLQVRNQVIGVFVVGDYQDFTYGCSELAFIEQLADQLAICIENARLYKEVSKGKQEWEATFRAVPDPIFLIDRQYNVLRHNHRNSHNVPEMTDQEEKPKCYSVLWKRTAPCENCSLEEVHRTGKGVYRQLQNDGAIFDAFYYPMVDSSGETYAVIVHVKDVTEKVKMEAQLVHSAKMVAIGEMAAGVAHELNSPMTVIIGTAQMMQRDMGSDDPRAEWLDDIISCGMRCKKIIQNLLSFSRQGQFSFTATNINEQVEKVLSLIHYQINRNNIEIVKDLDPGIPDVLANGHQLQQVLINLLLNARDALEETTGEKRISISTGVVSEENKTWAVIAVSDNGCGIEPDNLNKIFNPFYTSKEASKGTGLGLSVSLGIAQSHGGTIKVESRPGEGSTFRFLIPLKNESGGEI